MNQFQAVEAARNAVSFNPDKPASATLLDTPDVRLIVFRLAPGQVVPPHGNASTVLLTVLSGSGIVAGMDNGSPCERTCTVGDVIAYSPNETHSMRAAHNEFLLLATITPRPGTR
ncbi:hypothetical protein BH09GEM1_BH09GEM1_12500 [soil metagenome]